MKKVFKTIMVIVIIAVVGFVGAMGYMTFSASNTSYATDEDIPGVTQFTFDKESGKTICLDKD